MTTRALAEFTAGIKPDALPPEVRRQAARHTVYWRANIGHRLLPS